MLKPGMQGFRVDGFVHLIDDPAPGQFEHLQKDFFLVAEVMKQGSFGRSRELGDRCNGGVLEPLFSEQMGGGFQNGRLVGHVVPRFLGRLQKKTHVILKTE